jgi:hypothetical protein
MFATQCLIACVLAACGQEESAAGAITGRVLNASQSDHPCAETEVVLQAKSGGEFFPVAKTVTDAQGQFQFERLPTGSDIVYLPGANRQDVHYPGPRLVLTAQRPAAAVELRVHDATAAPNPLVSQRHEVVITPEPGVLRISESLEIENPTGYTYLGSAPAGQAEPVTLELSIPSDFERVTFAEEFFGRNFAIRNERLVTGIPWTPGRRVLSFTYVIRNEEAHRLWQRTLDLPTRQLRVCVEHDRVEEVASSLGNPISTEPGRVVFAGARDLLPLGLQVRVELGTLPLSWTHRARWWALAILVVLLVCATAVLFRKPRHRADRASEPAGTVAKRLPESARAHLSRRKSRRKAA